MRALLLGAMAALVALIVALVWAGSTHECDDVKVGAQGVSLNLQDYPLYAVSTAVVCVEAICTDFTIDAGTAWIQSEGQEISGTVKVAVQLRDANGVDLINASTKATVSPAPQGSHLGSSSCSGGGYLSLRLSPEGALEPVQLVEG